MTDRRWLDGARAPRRALDALASLAEASSPSRHGGHVLRELTADPLRTLTVAAELPPPLHAALRRLEQPAGQADGAASPRRARSAELGARPPARAVRAGDAPARAERPTAERAAAADPAAVKRAVREALALAATTMGTMPGGGAMAPTGAPRWRPPGGPATGLAAAASVAVAAADAAVAGSPRVPPRPEAAAPAGLSGFAARIAGGAAVARQPLTLGPGGAEVGGGGARSETRTTPATSPPAEAPPLAPRLSPRPISSPDGALPPHLAADAAAAAAPRNLAGLVEHWSRRSAPAADLVPVAGAPALRAPAPAAAPAMGTVIARVADEPPRAGELIALDALTHAIERVLVAEVRRHGLVVEES